MRIFPSSHLKHVFGRALILSHTQHSKHEPGNSQPLSLIHNSPQQNTFKRHRSVEICKTTATTEWHTSARLPVQTWKAQSTNTTCCSTRCCRTFLFAQGDAIISCQSSKSGAARSWLAFMSATNSASLRAHRASAASAHYISAGLPTKLRQWLLHATLGAYLCEDGCGALAAPRKQIAAASLVKLLS